MWHTVKSYSFGPSFASYFRGKKSKIDLTYPEIVLSGPAGASLLKPNHCLCSGRHEEKSEGSNITRMFCNIRDGVVSDSFLAPCPCRLSGMSFAPISSPPCVAGQFYWLSYFTKTLWSCQRSLATGPDLLAGLTGGMGTPEPLLGGLLRLCPLTCGLADLMEFLHPNHLFHLCVNTCCSANWQRQARLRSVTASSASLPPGGGPVSWSSGMGSHSYCLSAMACGRQYRCHFNNGRAEGNPHSKTDKGKVTNAYFISRNNRCVLKRKDWDKGENSRLLITWEALQRCKAKSIRDHVLCCQKCFHTRTLVTFLYIFVLQKKKYFIIRI